MRISHAWGQFLAAVTVATALVATAYGAHSIAIAPVGSIAGTGTAPGGSAATQHNVADVTFVQVLIPHHTQAIAMAKLAPAQATLAQVRDLAMDIEQNQGPELAQLRGFLTTWAVTEDPENVDGRGTTVMDPSFGMMSPARMTELAQTTGVEFDQMFLRMMTEHHSSAVQMAKAELIGGRNNDAKALAQQVISAQNSEIFDMQAVLGTLR